MPAAQETFENATPNGDLASGQVGTIFDADHYQAGSGSMVISALSPYRGTQHVRITNDSAYSFASTYLGTAYQTVYLRLYFKVVTSPADGVEFLFAGSNGNVTVDGLFGIIGQPSGGPKLRVRIYEQFGPGVLATGTLQLTVGQWYRADSTYVAQGGTHRVRLYTGSTITSTNTADAVENVVTATAGGNWSSRAFIGFDYYSGASGVVDVDQYAWSTDAIPEPIILSGVKVRSAGSWVTGTPKVRVGGSWVAALDVKYRTGGVWVSAV